MITSPSESGLCLGAFGLVTSSIMLCPPLKPLVVRGYESKGKINSSDTSQHVIHLFFDLGSWIYNDGYVHPLTDLNQTQFDGS
jgi:hypothetical protein